MTVAQAFAEATAEQLMAAVTCASAPVVERLRALRAIKNRVIGSRTRKRQFQKVDIVSAAVRILQSSNNDTQKQHSLDAMIDAAEEGLMTDLRVEAAAVLASLAISDDDAIRAELASDSVLAAVAEHLSRSDDDVRLAYSCARALKVLVRGPEHAASNGAGAAIVYSPEIIKKTQLDKKVETLILHSTSPRLTEMAVSILAGIAASSSTSSSTAGSYINANTLLRPLLRFIHPNRLSSNHHVLQESAFDALSSLCNGDASICKEITNSADVVLSHTLTALRSPDRPIKRLNAAAFLTNLHRTMALEAPHSSVLYNALLPTLIRLIADTHLERASVWRALGIFSDLVSTGEEMQRAAMEGCAVSVMKTFILADGKDVCGVPSAASKAPPLSSGEIIPFLDVTTKSVWVERLKEAALVALASVCSNCEASRKQIIDHNLLPITVATLSNPKTSLRAAACLLIRSISRSVKTLRSSLVDAGVATPLLACLADSSSQSVQLSASAALCNLVLDFSPMKSQVLDSGGLDSFVRLLDSPHPGLRLNAIWAIKNLLFHADTPTKRRVLASLTYARILRLIASEQDTNLLEQSLNLLRNLVCGSKLDVEEALEGLGASALFSTLARHLEGDCETVVLQALYVVVNVSTGDAAVRDSVMRSDEVVTAIKRFLGSSKAPVRLAAVWCVINLAEGDVEGAEERVKALIDMGVEHALRLLSDDADTDVRDRVRTAIVAFGGPAPAESTEAAAAADDGGEMMAVEEENNEDEHWF